MLRKSHVAVLYELYYTSHKVRFRLMAVFSAPYKLCSEIHSVQCRLHGINIMNLYVCATHGSWQYPIYRRGSFALSRGFPY